MDVREPIYTFEIARRSVGRAAFHLGIDTISEGALDVLADILLNYLNRVGRTLSHMVESSGRTSAHVNILDALHACELVASPAVERLHLRPVPHDTAEDDDNDNDETSNVLFAGTHKARTHLSSDWKGLAAFLFGPKWLTSSDTDGESERTSQGNNNESNGTGGKVGPSTSDPPKKIAIGWNAPCLDEIPPFPVASEKCANPHPLVPYVGLSLHRAPEETEMNQVEIGDSSHAELDHIPDKVFTGSSWGDIGKRKASSLDETQHTEEKEDVIMMTDADGALPATAPPRKKVKIDDGSALNVKDDEADAVNHTKREEKDHQTQINKIRLHIPSFYPAPPLLKSSTAAQQGRTVIDTSSLPPRVNESVESSKSVRSSLVQLGSYWGSGWDAPDVDTSRAVPLGRNSSNEGPSSDLVIPLVRASGSRVSRILEGSMDAAAMQ